MADTEQQQPMAEDSENSPHQQEQPPAEPDHVSKPPDHQRPTHQKCPRCESEHTKFCYYNNYSLNQPRYYCKTCKRYWTHGGALRNVPVGGSCRKRAKLSSPSSSSGDDYFMSQPSPPQLPHLSQNVNVPNNEYANLGMVDPIYAGVGGEYLSCLAAMQGLNYPFTDGNFGGIGNSNYGIIQGYNNVANFGSQEQMMQQQQQPSEEVYKMGNESFEANGGLGNWTEGLINSSANVPGEFNPSGSGLDPNQWLDNVNGSGFRPDP